MITTIKYTAACLCILFFARCKNIAKYPIDETPLVPIDTGILGIWKAVEDTDKANYFLVQSYTDAFHEYDRRYKNAPTEFKNESDYVVMRNKFMKNKNYFLFVTYMDNHGTNPRYQEWSCYPSDVKNKKIFNFGALGSIMEGYVFVELINMNATHDKCTIARVADTTLQYLAGSAAVRKKIEQNINEPSFYSDTMHFYKASTYHASINGSVGKAN